METAAQHVELRQIAFFISKHKLEAVKTKLMLACLPPARRRQVMAGFKPVGAVATTTQLDLFIRKCKELETAEQKPTEASTTGGQEDQPAERSSSQIIPKCFKPLFRHRFGSKWRSESDQQRTARGRILALRGRLSSERTDQAAADYTRVEREDPNPIKPMLKTLGSQPFTPGQSNSLEASGQAPQVTRDVAINTAVSKGAAVLIPPRRDVQPVEEMAQKLEQAHCVLEEMGGCNSSMGGELLQTAEEARIAVEGLARGLNQVEDHAEEKRPPGVVSKSGMLSRPKPPEQPPPNHVLLQQAMPKAAQIVSPPRMPAPPPPPPLEQLVLDACAAQLREPHTPPPASQRYCMQTPPPPLLGGQTVPLPPPPPPPPQLAGPTLVPPQAHQGMAGVKAHAPACSSSAKASAESPSQQPAFSALLPTLDDIKAAEEAGRAALEAAARYKLMAESMAEARRSAGNAAVAEKAATRSRSRSGSGSGSRRRRYSRRMSPERSPSQRTDGSRSSSWRPPRRSRRRRRRRSSPRRSGRAEDQSWQRDGAGMLTVPVDDLFFTHDSIARRFRDGRPLQRLIDELCSGHVDPLQADFLILETCSVNGKLMCINNRRLFCVREFQKRSARMIFLRVKITEIVQPGALKLFQAWTSKSEEGEVPVRNFGHGSKESLIANHLVREESRKRRKLSKPWDGEASQGNPPWK
mmetsp:Transcript_133176/g.249045  ORF Transcript_133176/g.249045 Transcript_133176/m.249045 type:complete len:694 (-) Transcript_133176:194-2275(-)